MKLKDYSLIDSWLLSNKIQKVLVGGELVIL